jgi:hypothetical protein
MSEQSLIPSSASEVAGGGTMSWQKHPLWALAYLTVVPLLDVRAGMPSPLPTNIDPSSFAQQVDSMMRLEPEALQRLCAISFFGLCFFLSAWTFKLLWNYLQRDFSSLPRLSYAKALGFVFLWGLLFVVVLTMISGARELMTPGAWQKQGFTYKLAASKNDRPANPEAVRRLAIEKLRRALWKFAATHEGRFPASLDASIPDELWEIPGTGRVRYVYREGKSAGHAPSLLAYEVDLDPDRRFALLANGDIVSMTTAEIEKSSK